MLEIENTVAGMKNTFDGVISRLEPEKRISEPESTFLEIIQSDTQREK